MAINNSSNGSSSSDSDNASPPSPPSPSTSSDDSDPPQSAPSKSPPPPPSPPQSPPPPLPSHSPPPPPSHSPPPSSSPPPPSPPPPSKSPPRPPPSQPPKSSPPPQPSSPPPKGSPPPPSQSKPPPTPPPPPSSPPPASAPPPSTPSPPNGDSPPPGPLQQTPPPQSQTPPPPNNMSSSPTPPAPASHVTPAPAPPTGSVPNHPPISPGSHPKTSPSKSPSTPTSKGSGDNTEKIIGFTIGGVFILAVVALLLFLVLRRRKKNRGNLYAVPPPNNFYPRKGGANVHYYLEEQGVGNGSQNGFYSAQLTSPRTNYGNGNHAGAMDHLRSPSDPAAQPMGQIVFSYDKIVEITDGFSSQNVIGEGGFGCVYKASMPDGRIGAVKLLKAGSGQGEREFRAEVDIISRIHHRHLVSLIGYCISEQQRVLIYEFVPNGNLSHHMHGSGVPVLNWEKRMKIANGSARGLAYLHEGCNPKIIHRDIKSPNILLDDDYEAQVADFGLARLTDDANTHVSTRVMGTFGYMAPEYATSGKLTDRSDVFSFGVVLLELITGRKPVDPTQPVGEESLVEWARPLLLRAIETGDFSELVDPRLEGQYIDSEMFRMIEAAAACVRHSAPKRPRMVQVARALDTGDQYDLSNGVKYGQSTVYDSGQYNEDIERFKRMANGSFGDSDFDMYSDYSSKEMSGSKSQLMPSSSTADSEIKAYYSLKNSAAENRS